MELFNHGKWIWVKGLDKPNTYVSFTTAFEADKNESIIMYISAETDYAVYINGEFIDCDQYPDYPFDKVYDKLDVSKYCGKDNSLNEIRIDVYHQGIDSSTRRAETPGLIFEIYKGERLVSFSGISVSSELIDEYDMGREVELVTGQLGYSFRYDKRRSKHTACETVICDKPFPTRERPIKKLAVGGNKAVFVKNTGSFVDCGGNTIGQRMQDTSLAYSESPIGVTLPAEQGVCLFAKEGFDGIYVILDTGCESVGFFSIDIDVPEDCPILAGWGEHLDDMRIRTFVGGRSFALGYYAEKGKNRFVHPFRRLGMRYMQLHIYSQSARIYYAGIKTADYPIDKEYVFECADTLHNMIYETSVRTLKMCMHEHYEDCPWREQALYTMDSRNQMLCGYYAFGEYAFPAASIRIMAESIRDDGLLELCSPARVSITIPSFTAVFIYQVWEYMKYSGDKKLVEEIFPILVKIADGFERKSENGLMPCYTEEQYWNFYEWQTGLEGSISGSVAESDITYDAPLCAFVSLGVGAMSEICRELYKTHEAEHYRELKERINTAADKYFWSEEHGAYATYIKKSDIGNADCSRYHYAELTNALMVCCGAAKNNRAKTVSQKLKRKELIPVTLSYSIFKYEAMIMSGNDMVREVFKNIADDWGHMLKNNATTFWETINGAEDFNNAGSLCHGWSAIPIYFYFKYAMNLPGKTTGLYECKIHKKA